MSQLDEINELATTIHAAKIGKKRTVAGSVEYVTGHAGDLAGFQYFDDFVAALVRNDATKDVRAISHHLENVRNEVARELWKRHFGVGLYTLDELLFEAVQRGEPDPVMAVLDRLRRSTQNTPGLVIFPLRSFGVLASGQRDPFRTAAHTLVQRGAGFAIITQTNDLRQTIALIDKARDHLGVTQSIDPTLIQHWRDSRGADWLERNPILIARMTTIAGYYNENEFLTLGRIQIITASIVMMAAMQPRRKDESGSFLNSRAINNDETLDINHYLVMIGGRRQTLDGEAVPIFDGDQARELSGLAVDIDPSHWHRETVHSKNIFSALELLFAGYLQHSLQRQQGTLGNVHRKVMEAVTFFRRSFHHRRDDWTAVISLATAFEMLLTDHFERGVKTRLRTRTQTLLRGVRGTRRYQAAVETLYEARSATVHKGQVPRLDLHDAQQAFVLCFLEIMSRMPRLPQKQPNPMAYLTT